MRRTLARLVAIVAFTAAALTGLDQAGTVYAGHRPPATKFTVVPVGAMHDTEAFTWDAFLSGDDAG